MAQLKSFKFIGADQQQQQHQATESEEGSSSPSLSSSSLMSAGGPNLTTSDSSSGATLASGEEYQTARFELRASSDEGESSPSSNKPTQPISSGGRRALSMSPHAPRPQQQQQQQQPPLRQQVVESPSARRGSLQASAAGEQQQSSSADFEVRWRQINLMSRRSRLPRIIADNALYKALTQQQQKGDTCYSPPLRLKATNLAQAELQRSVSPKLDRWHPQPANPDGSQADSASSSAVKTILNNVSGSVFSGQLTAVLGPSGVGKTTLLNSLTGRNTLDGSGRVSLVGSADRKRMAVVTVPQQDVLPGRLTAMEDLQFTSRLKNPQRNFQHSRNIDRVVRHLQMEKFLHTRIDKLSGGEARRLSIGRELLSSPDIMILDEPTSGLDANTCKKIIGALRDIVEHSELYLDRPMAIIVTIHQPQQEVLNLFHRLYVMALGGRAIYEGPPSALLAHLLANSSLASRCLVEELNENPAIVALEVASGEYGPQVIDELAACHESLCAEQDQLYPLLIPDEPAASPSFLSGLPHSARLHRKLPSQSPAGLRGSRDSPRSLDPRRLNHLTPQLELRRQQQKQIAQQQQFDRLSNVTSLSYASTYDADLPEPTGRLKVDKRLRRSVVMRGDFLRQTYTLMRRCWLLTTRDFFLMAIRIIGFLLVAGGMVQIFAHSLDPNESACPAYQSEVDDIPGYMESTRLRLLNLQSVLSQSNNTHMFFFQLVLSCTMVSAALAGLAFPIQMRMFMREYKNGWYSPASFIASQTLAELPADMIGPAITVLVSYTLCHQPESSYHWRQLGYILVLCISAIICKSQAQVVGAFLMNSVEMSVFLSCVLVCPNALLSGIAVRIQQMSTPLQWVSYGSFLRFTFESLFLMRYGYGICPCDPQTVQGYPVAPTAQAIPEQLDRLARGLVDLNLPAATQNETTNTALGDPQQPPPNLFVSFIRLVMEASNLFVPNPSQLGSCQSYRSLYLMDMNIPDGILPAWIGGLLLMLICSRFITYFAVKTVIKLKQ